MAKNKKEKQTEKKTASADVPVRAVVLYSSGVGYFEHTGKVSGSATTELKFKAAQINDVLKSLVLQDEGGGKIGTIIYPSFDPIAKALKSFQVDLTENPSLAALLNQLRGAKVTVKLSTETITGTILGLEMRSKATEHFSIDYWVLNVLVGGTIRAIVLDEARSITPEDENLQAELARALGTVAQSRDQDKKPVTIAFDGKGERTVHIGYVVEAPIWKSSYRLILPDEGSKDQAHLQGWAIIENQTDNDWPEVQLTLVSGRPISFVQDLYSPMYIERPWVQPELYSSLRPQVYGGGVRPAVAASAAPAEGGGGAAAPEGRNFMAMERSAPLRRRSKMSAADAEAEIEETTEARYATRGAGGQRMQTQVSVASAAEAAKLGELFQYTVASVTLPRQKSAMIPIVTDPISAERLSIYNEDVLAKHPLSGIRLTNNTGKHLLQGPVTVLSGGAYAGDARIDNLPPNQNRFLSYGIDLQMQVVTSKDKNEGEVLTIKIAKGFLVVTVKQLTKKIYTFENKGEKKKKAMLEHPLNTVQTLVDTPAPAETTDTHYRFVFDVDAGETKKFTVTLQFISEQREELISANLAHLDRILKNPAASENIRPAITDIVAKRRALQERETEIAALEKQVKELSAEQGRIRENLKTVPESSQYHGRLLSKLNEQETKFEELQKQIEALTARKKKMFDELSEKIFELDIS